MSIIRFELGIIMIISTATVPWYFWPGKSHFVYNELIRVGSLAFQADQY